MKPRMNTDEHRSAQPQPKKSHRRDAESAEKENEKERYNYSPAVRECEKIV